MDITYYLDEAIKNIDIAHSKKDTLLLLNFSAIPDGHFLKYFDEQCVIRSSHDTARVNILVVILPPSNFNIDKLIRDRLHEKKGMIVVVNNNPNIPFSKPAIQTIKLSREQDKHLAENYGLRPVFREPIGKMSQLGGLFKKVGEVIPNTKVFSPFSLHVYSTEASLPLRYIERSSLPSKIMRLSERFMYRAKNSLFHHYYEKGIAMINLLPISDRFFKHTPVKRIRSTQRKHIAIVTGQLGVGGVESVLLAITRALSVEYDITLYTTNWNANQWTSKFNGYTVDIRHIPSILGHKWPARFVTRYLQEDINAQRPDAIFITNSEAGYNILPFMEYSPIVIDLLHTHGTPREKDAFLRISHPYDKYIDTRIVISRYLRDYFVHHYKIDANKIRVIYNGVGQLDNSELKGSPGYTTEKQRIISYIGRLQQDKSPQRIIHAAAQLKEFLIKKDTVIQIFGDGELKNNLVELAEKLDVLDSVLFFKDVTDKPLEVMRSSRYTLLCSNLEGISMSVLESMSVGTPVIATATGGTPEIIDNSVNGFLFSISNSNEQEVIDNFCAHIKKALSVDNSQYSKLSNAARSKIKSTFSSMESEYLDLFHNALK